MKIKIVSLLLLLFIGNCIVPQKATAQVSVSFQVFYDDLSPHGTWINNPDYGYVWVPNVSPGFTPYRTNGHWVYTDFGWTWASNYSWGWAAFHYGRWYTDPIYGPIWVPGNEWSPGWVTWRSSGSYYGWAPIGPGVSIEMAYGSGYYAPYNQYTFVRSGYMGSTNINNYYVNTSNNTTIINTTTVINNTRVDQGSNVTYNAGPQRSEVEQRAGKTFTPVAVKENSKPGQNLSGNELRIYRPQVQKGGSDGAKPAPAKVASLKDIKTTTERRAATQPQKVNQPVKQQPSQPQRETQPTKQQPSQPQRDAQPAKQQPSQPQRSAEPTKQQPSQPKREIQPTKQQPSQPQRETQPTKRQPSQPQREAQPTKQQQPQRETQPAKQQPSQPQKVREPSRPQQSQPQRESQPNHQQPSQPQHNAQPPKQEHSQPQRNEPPRQQQSSPPQGNPNQNNGGEKKPR